MNVAMLLGKSHEAQVRILHLSPDPSDYVGLYGEGLLVNGDILDSIEKQNEERLRYAKEQVACFAARHNIPLDQPDVPMHHASAQFIHQVGNAAETIAREGRLTDLIVMGRSDAATHDFVTPALFDTGRPLLLIPPATGDLPQEWNDKTIVVAWDGSMQASRAIYNAMPLMRKAEKVFTLTARETNEPFSLETGSGMMGYLLRHGFPTQGITVATGKQNMPDLLLSQAHDLHADLLVVGAYGHSQFQEMLIGGVTEHLLHKADIPLLLSH